MIRAILVDDEPMTRGGLRRFIDWEGLGIEIAGEAEDGIEAYERFIELRPELVLCDVRMPRMDGIEFARRIRQIDPECKLIFLSGYNDLNYLKSAIKLQAVDYMLKPIQMGELTGLLRETVQSINQAKSAQLELTVLRERFERSQPERKERLLKSILGLDPGREKDSHPLEEELVRLYPELSVRGYYQCAAFEFQNGEALRRWKEEAEPEAEVLGLTVLTGTEDGLGMACIPIDSARGDDRPALWLNRLTRRKGQEELGVSAGLGEYCTHLNGCGSSYQQAVQALAHRFYRGWHTVIRYGSLPAEGIQPGLFDKQAILKFEELLRGKQFQAAMECLDQTINELLLLSPLDVEMVRHKLFRWYVTMALTYPETMWTFENDRLWTDLFVSGELYLIRKFMLERLETIRQAEERDQPGEKAVIREILGYIHDHYSEDISINTLAAHVHLAPTYMCILFKKEKGVSINDYATQYRISQAKRLLGDRRLKLYEVAARVGYQDPNYFAKVFRKQTGMIPSQYRETMGAK